MQTPEPRNDPAAAPGLLDRVLGRVVSPADCRIVKMMPTNPPLRGTIVLVDDVRCRVTRAKVSWDGPVWTIHKLRVKEAPSV